MQIIEDNVAVWQLCCMPHAARGTGRMRMSSVVNSFHLVCFKHTERVLRLRNGIIISKRAESFPAPRAPLLSFYFPIYCLVWAATRPLTRHLKATILFACHSVGCQSPCAVPASPVPARGNGSLGNAGIACLASNPFKVGRSMWQHPGICLLIML